MSTKEAARSEASRSPPAETTHWVVPTNPNPVLRGHGKMALLVDR
jgi:hypothetical protein